MQIFYQKREEKTNKQNIREKRDLGSFLIIVQDEHRLSEESPIFVEP